MKWIGETSFYRAVCKGSQRKQVPWQLDERYMLENGIIYQVISSLKWSLFFSSLYLKTSGCSDKYIYFLNLLFRPLTTMGYLWKKKYKYSTEHWCSARPFVCDIFKHIFTWLYCFSFAFLLHLTWELLVLQNPANKGNGLHSTHREALKWDTRLKKNLTVQNTALSSN